MAQAVVQAEGQTLALDCRGGEARVEGNRNRVSFRGACRALRVFGEENRVTAQVTAGAEIEVQGQRNRVSYALTGGTEPPRVSVAGLDDTVGPGAMPVAPAAPTAPMVALAAPAPTIPRTPTPRPPAALAFPLAPSPAPVPVVVPTGPLILRGDDQERAESCAGRDTVIEGHRGNYVLRGGCRSLTVRGDLIVVQVELVPRAQVMVDGNGTAVHWVLVGRGPSPTVTIRGDGSRAMRASGPVS